MKRIHAQGVFAWQGSDPPPHPVHVRISEAGREFETFDPYSFVPAIGADDLYCSTRAVWSRPIAYWVAGSNNARAWRACASPAGRRTLPGSALLPIQPLGRACASDVVAWVERRVGAVHSRHRCGHALQVRDPQPRQRGNIRQEPTPTPVFTSCVQVRLRKSLPNGTSGATKRG
jgi:hypothetical protein